MGNLLKKKLENKSNVIGPFMKLPSPAVVEIAALAGFDFVIIDCEHGPLNMLEAENMIRAAHLSNMSAVIRVGENNPNMISRALDIGADAVQIPQISTKEDAINAVKSSKFSPLGERGVCKYVRAAGYSSMDKSEYFKYANENTLVIIHIEGLEGIENLDEILEVEGIDVIFIGPYDLSQSLGIPGDVNNVKVEEKMKEVVNKASAKGKIVGTFVDDIDAANKWKSLGIQYMSYAVDVGIIYDSFKRVTKGFK
ncbi:HpcH/HpaI aldolase family protein [Paratissierella segnis]|uniref:Aldolase n=1 Tax=Paratissierella segnis TaxID=2763679 RepID=A0A926EZJ4_9FIRM|nr:aldolase/citrate lyase family protein [Paratissierella segnis]MBC8589179.1 aldolase [Paratissierella segnis]